MIEIIKQAAIPALIGSFGANVALILYYWLRSL